MRLERDPVSEAFDAGARAFLDRAYRSPGEWRPTRLQDPEARHWAMFAGIDLLGPDDASVPGRPGLNARSRWARGFVRAIYHQHKFHSGPRPGVWRGDRRAVPRHAAEIEIRVGRHMPLSGVRPAGRMIYIRYDPGRADRYRLPKHGEGTTGPGQSDLRLRDWA
jgi:hypothetical protein